MSVSHPRPVVRKPVRGRGVLTAVGRKKGVASCSVFRSNTEGWGWRGQVSTMALRLVAVA